MEFNLKLILKIFSNKLLKEFRGMILFLIRAIISKILSKNQEQNGVQLYQILYF